jgi:two-component system chemotaxis response regulator CheY
MSYKVLLVDDSTTILNLLGMVFKEHGFEVIKALDGLQALDCLRAGPVDVMVTDVNMPRLDGFSLITQVRADPAWSSLPIVVLSTEADPRDQQRGLERGANLYLVKPIKPAQLVSHVLALLD